MNSIRISLQYFIDFLKDMNIIKKAIMSWYSLLERKKLIFLYQKNTKGAIAFGVVYYGFNIYK